MTQSCVSSCRETTSDCQDSFGSHPASCASNYAVKRYVCENEKCVSKDYICLSGDCSSSMFCSSVNLVEAYCSDSDNGWNFVVKGQCEDAFASYAKTDSCVDYNQILEYSCGYPTLFGSALKCLAERVTCSAGCENGACLPDNTIHTQQRK